MSRISARLAPSASAHTQCYESHFAPASETSQILSESVDALEDEWEEIGDKKLIDIGCLHDDWDGAGSLAPDRGVVAGAIKLAKKLQAEKKPVPGRVTASVNGTICFEWHTADGYFEIEVMSPVYAERYWVPKGAAEADIAPFPIP